MNTNTSLERLFQNHDVLSVSSINISKFARLQNIWQLMSLATWDEINWLNSSKVSNPETVKLAKYILRKATEILWYDPWDIIDNDIYPIALKIWEEMVESKTTENFIIWNYILKVAYQVKNIHLRYERLNKQIQNTELKKDSTRDHLTWLLNRRSMELYIDDAIANNKRNWENFWVIMIDIDFFKNINDTYWHNTWDAVLEEISELFRKFFREEDKICRWWWEEFLILMKWWNETAYLRKINTLKKEIEKTLVWMVNKKIKSYWCKCKEWKDHNSDEECHCEDEVTQESITISCWITSLKEIDTPFDAVKRADEWLYIAKASWRNRVEYIENEII